MGTISLDHASFTLKTSIHSGAGVLARLSCVALLDTGSPQAFMGQDSLDRMLSVRAVFTTCEHKCAPCSWGGVVKSAPPKTSTSERLSVQLVQED